MPTVTLAVLVLYSRRQVIRLECWCSCAWPFWEVYHTVKRLWGWELCPTTKGWLNNKEDLIVFLGYFQSSQAMCGETYYFRGLSLKYKSSLSWPTDKISFYGSDKQNSLMSVCCKNIKIGGLPWEGMFYGRKDTARIQLIHVITQIYFDWYVWTLSSFSIMTYCSSQ